MQHAKKWISSLLAFAVAMVFCLTAFAADSTYTITITNNASGHVYEAYQVFSGSLSDQGVLSNVNWGSGVDGAALLTALKGASISGLDFSSCTDAASVAEVLSAAKLGDDAAASQAFAQIVGQHLTASVSGTCAYADGKYTISGLAAGYYFVKDQDGSVTGNDSYTRFMLQVVKDVTVQPKSGSVTVEKKVKDTDDSAAVITGWQDSADYDIGDAVPFQLTGTLPADYADYSTYQYIFHDVESAGLTLNAGSVVVKADGSVIAADKYTVVTSGLTDGCTFEVKFADLKTIAPALTKDSVITVEYSATLNTSAVLGSAGNPNKVSLEFSNNSNQGGKGSTGKTPEDKVIVFTCVLSGHRGLPSSRLFTDLDRLQNGDIFLLHVLDETLAYQVDQILIVDPQDVSALGITAGEDYCTLVTCTPYGINTQRLLVRGRRVAYSGTTVQSAQLTADATAVDPLLVAAVLAAPPLLILLLCLLCRTAPKKKERRRPS